MLFLHKRDEKIANAAQPFAMPNLRLVDDFAYGLRIYFLMFRPLAITAGRRRVPSAED